MHDNEKHILEQFELKLGILIDKYKEQKELNEKLTQAIADKDAALGEMQQRYSELEQTYTNLKQARMISLTYEEVDNAKEHISRLVREIDQCIDLLIKKQ
jgi:predicted DNA-binding protein YlxM (UPF0122 family)